LLSTHSPPSADPSGSGWRSEIAEPISMGATYETAQERSAAVGWEVRQSCLLAGPAMSVELAFRTRPPTLTCNIIILFSPPEQPLPAAAPTARTPRALPHGAISAALGQRGSRASMLPSIEGDPEKQGRAQPLDVLSAISRGIDESTTPWELFSSGSVSRSRPSQCARGCVCVCVCGVVARACVGVKEEVLTRFVV
jgi:hypothetical protein